MPNQRAPGVVKLVCYVEKAERDYIKELCAKKGCTMSDIIRRGIREELRGHGKDDDDGKRGDKGTN